MWTCKPAKREDDKKKRPATLVLSKKPVALNNNI
jgi:hypothetical protein